MDMDHEEDGDPMISEIDVFVTSALSSCLYLVQYPIHPAHLASPGVEAGRVSEHLLQLDVGILPRGENYSSSRGEQFGRSCTSEYGNMMNKQTLVSDRLDQQHVLRYTAAVYKDGELHLSPVKGVIQLRPCLARLDQVDTVGHSDGEGMESEGEEVKPVQIRFTRPVNASNSARSKTFQQQLQQLCADSVWQPLTYNDIHSQAACDDRRRLFAPSDDQSNFFTLSVCEYFERICPPETTKQSKAPSHPLGVLSLDQLKAMPLPQRVRELIRREQVVQFGWLLSMLGGRNQSSAVCEALDGCAVLVQGCWVARSEVVYPEHDDIALRRARDYILWCFTCNRVIGRKDIAVISKVPHEQVKSILQSLATSCPGQGWEFKLSTDEKFLSCHTQVVHRQENFWLQRHKQLVVELRLPKEQHKLTATSNARPIDTTHPPDNTQTGDTPTLPLLQVPKVEPDLQATVMEFCQSVLRTDILSFAEIRDRLMLKQANACEGNLLRAGVPDTLLEKCLLSVGAIELGKDWGRRLFAMELTGRPSDEYRQVLLKMFQSVKSVRRKQVSDQISKDLGHEPDTKVLTGVLKEVCYSRGGQWHMMGT